jgi:para-nitrobenzyl esterase
MAYHAQGDCRYSCPAHRGARLLAQHGNTVFHYLFNGWDSDVLPFAIHAAEVPYYFLTQPGEMARQQTQLSVAMAVYWTNFARTGDPNKAGLPASSTFFLQGLPGGREQGDNQDGDLAGRPN